MKKMLIILLSLGMILSGCIHNENPEEPPVVEDETEKQPAINEDIIIDVESGGNDEESLSKNDDESNLGDEIVENPNDNEQNVYKNENINENEDQEKWIFIEEEYVYKRPENAEKLLTTIYSNGDEFENWYNNNYYRVSYLRNFYITFNSTDAENINEDIKRIYEDYLPFLVAGYAPRYQDYRSFENEKYLSVVRKYGVFLPGSTYEKYIRIYNFDLETGKLLSNQEVLDIYGWSLEEVNNYLENYYTSIGSKCCKQEGITYDDLPKEEQQSCFGALRTDVDKLEIFIDDNMNLIVLSAHVSENEGEYYPTSFKYNLGLPRN